VLPGEPLHLLLGAELVVDEPGVAVAAQLGVLDQEVRVLGVRAVDQRRRDHHEPARLDAGAGVQHVHRAHVLELVRPLHGVRRVREERAVDEDLDRVLLEQRGEVAVDGGLREIDLDELDLAAGHERGRPDVERQHPIVPRILLEPAEELGAEERARARDRDDARLGVAARHGGAL
jgi:hypothetical protein